MAGCSIDPNYVPHKQLEQDVTEYLQSIGYFVDSAPYHSKMDRNIVERLQNIYTPTALYLRSRADRIAVKARPPSVFEWEAKTHKSKTKHDCLVEAYPICVHILKYRNLGVRCLYVYRNPFAAHEVGFWIHQLPPIRVVMIPPRWNEEQIRWFESLFAETLPDTDIIRLRKRTAGTDDPFLIIDENIIQTLPHWRIAIQRGENGANEQ